PHPAPGVAHPASCIADPGSREPELPAATRLAVPPGRVVGNHFHLERHERIALISGAAEVRLMDCRPRTPGFGAWNCFALDQPGLAVTVPARVAHAVRAGEAGAERGRPLSPASGG